MKKQIAIVMAAGSLAAAGCGGGDQAAKMTSFSTTPRADSQAELTAISADQLSHIQIYTVSSAPLPHTLRLTGAVAYNGFLTTPVITQVGGPVSRILVTPGEHVRAGQPLLYVTSPDFSQLRTAYLKARDAFELADKFFKRAQDLYMHGAIAQADLEQTESTRAQAKVDLDAVGRTRTDGPHLRRVDDLEGTGNEGHRQGPAGRTQPDDRHTRSGDCGSQNDAQGLNPTPRGGIATTHPAVRRDRVACRESRPCPPPGRRRDRS